MPELPEVETVRRGLNKFTCDRTITNTEILLERTIATPNQEFNVGLQGTQILQWHRRGKYLFTNIQESEFILRAISN